MNRIFSDSLIAGFLFVIVTSEAQELTPTEPYLNRAPVYSQWTEVFQPSKSSRAPAGSSTSGPPEMKQMIVSKAETTRHESCQWTDGQISERWLYKGFVLFQQLGSSTVFILNSSNVDSLSNKVGYDFSQSDFPKLNWLSKQTYEGVATVNKVQCYHFQKTVPAPVVPPPAGQKQAAKPAPPLTMDAWIDVNTKLPVASDDGRWFTTYTFKEMPEKPLELPPVFAKALENYH